MAGDAASGLATAVAAAMAEAGDDAPVVRAVQLPLLPAEEVAALPEDPAARRAALAKGARGRGRPPGAANRKTTDWSSFILARHRSPLEFLAETFSRAAGDLADELGCTKLEAFQTQIRAATELAPYLHGKAPVQVNVGGAMPILQLVDPRFLVLREGAAVLDLTALQPIHNTPDGGSEGGTENG